MNAEIDLSEDAGMPEEVLSTIRTKASPSYEEPRSVVQRTIAQLLREHWPGIELANGQPLVSFTVAIEQVGDCIRGRICYQRRVNESIEVRPDSTPRLL